MGRIMNWIRSVTDRMFGQKTFYRKAGVPDNAVTTDMVNAIDRWCNLYENNAPWLSKDHTNLSLPSRIASDIATMVTLEMEVKVSGEGQSADAGPGDQPKTRADFLQQQIQKVMDVIQEQTEYACAKGGLVFKPYIEGERGIGFDFVQADDFYPCAYDRESITSAVFLAKKKVGSMWYTRVEKHTLDRKNKEYLITNNCYRSESDTDIGNPTPLTDVPEWADFDPEVTISGVETPLFAYFRIPLGNTIDPKSPLGVSVYARADQSGLLEKADRQYQSLMWEYEGGEMAIDASKDAFKTTRGEPQLPAGKERLYRMNTIDGQNTSDELLKTFAPTLRDESYIRGLQQTLKQIEDTCGMSRGSISEAEIEARSATEIKMAKQRTYSTVSGIQKALKKALTELVAACDYLADLYNLAPDGEYELKFVFDDSLVVDSDAEKQRDLEEIGQGIMQKWEYRVKWYGEDEETAKSMVAQEQPNDALMGFGLPNKKTITPNRQQNGQNGGQNDQNNQEGGENQ